MDNDLISREALKNQFINLWDLKFLPVLQKKLLGIIDDAPIVSSDMTQVLAYESGKASAKRPQSKWKGYIRSAFHGVDEYGEPIYRPVTVYTCSKCYRRTVIKENFCPNCGADMRKGGGAE